MTCTRVHAHVHTPGINTKQCIRVLSRIASEEFFFFLLTVAKVSKIKKQFIGISYHAIPSLVHLNLDILKARLLPRLAMRRRMSQSTAYTCRCYWSGFDLPIFPSFLFSPRVGITTPICGTRTHIFLAVHKSGVIGNHHLLKHRTLAYNRVAACPFPRPQLPY